MSAIDALVVPRAVQLDGSSVMVQSGDATSILELRVQFATYRDHLFWMTPLNHQTTAVGACLHKIPELGKWLESQAFVYPMYGGYWPDHNVPLDTMAGFRCMVCWRRLDMHDELYQPIKGAANPAIVRYEGE